MDPAEQLKALAHMLESHAALFASAAQLLGLSVARDVATLCRQIADAQAHAIRASVQRGHLGPLMELADIATNWHMQDAVPDNRPRWVPKIVPSDN